MDQESLNRGMAFSYQTAGSHTPKSLRSKVSAGTSNSRKLTNQNDGEYFRLNALSQAVVINVIDYVDRRD